MGGLVKHHGPRLIRQRRQPLLSRQFLTGQKTFKCKPVGGKPRHTQRRHQCACAWYGDDRELPLSRQANQSVSGVGYQRRTRIRNQSNRAAGFQLIEDTLYRAVRREIMMGNHRSFDLYTLQQLLTVARILGSYKIHSIQNLDRPPRDIVEVSNRGCNNVERPGISHYASFSICLSDGGVSFEQLR